GGGFVMFNVYLQHLLGTGLTVILNLIGLTAGGMFVDKTGVLESPKKTVTLQRVLGVLVMLGGAAMIRLL
ncbi:MAG: DMT family transporter, partial [Clostridia bacterium]|nr:DMT family transporter [Clostridia bacterium]